MVQDVECWEKYLRNFLERRDLQAQNDMDHSKSNRKNLKMPPVEGSRCLGEVLQADCQILGELLVEQRSGIIDGNGG